MMRPPPTEPGTPPRNSTPPSPASVAVRSSLPVETPASTMTAAGPPMRSVVWRAIGSSRRSSPSPARSLSSGDLILEQRQELGAAELDVAGAERDHDVAGAGDR